MVASGRLAIIADETLDVEKQGLGKLVHDTLPARHCLAGGLQLVAQTFETVPAAMRVSARKGDIRVRKSEVHRVESVFVVGLSLKRYAKMSSRCYTAGAERRRLTAS